MIKFSKGDVVTIRGTVEYINRDDSEIVGVKLDGAYQAVYVPVENLTFLHSRFEIGERVYIQDAQLFGTVRAINHGSAWIEREDRRDYVTANLHDLDHAPVTASAEAA